MDTRDATAHIRGPFFYVLGSLAGFLFASLVVFGSVALFERQFYKTLGLYGAYGVWTAMFVIIGGLALTFLTPGQRVRMFLSYSAGFIAYSAAWVAAYFTLKGFAGEVVGLVIGSFAMGLSLAVGLKGNNHIAAGVILIVGNVLGYFIGESIWKGVGGQLGMILWGVPYGVFFGAAIGLAIWAIKK